MVRALLCAVMGMSLMLCAASTNAREFELSVDTRVGGDSNVFRRTTRPKRFEDNDADGFWEISPRAGLRDEQNEFQYDFGYRPTYTSFFDTAGIDGWDHSVEGDVLWSITPVDTLGAEGTFVQRRQLRLFEDGSGATLGDPDAIAAEESDRQKIRRSTARLFYVRAITSRLSARADYNFSDYDFVPNSNPLSQQVDSRAHTFSAGPTLTLDRVTQAGLTGAIRFRENPGLESQRQISTETTTWDVSLSLSRELSPTMSASVAAGPSFIRTQQEVPVSLVGSGPRFSEDRDVSFFAAANIEKEWQRSSLALSYSRFESSTGGASSSSIVDQLNLTGRHRFTQDLFGRAVLSWTQREFLVDSEFQSDERTRRFSVVGILRYRFTEQAAVSSRFSYRNELRQFDGASQDSRTTEIYRGFVAFEYTFEPFIF